MLPLGAVLKYHGIGYHADDTQLYITFKCNNPLSSLPKLNRCISDIRVWMIKNKFCERSFLYGVPYEWNKLDERVKQLTDFIMFKSEIKTLLF